MLKALKRSILKSAQHIRLTSFLGSRRWRRDRLLILGYHGISIDDEHQWDPALYLSQELFSERMRALGNCNVLSLEDGLARLASNSLPDRSVAITFDDGTYDFLACAYPILKQFKYPVTVYQTTFYSAYNRPVFNGVCSYILWKARSRRRIEIREFAGVAGEWDLTCSSSRAALTVKILQFSRQMSAEDKDQLLQQLAQQLDVDFSSILHKRLIRLMTPEEITLLSNSGVNVQLHTHRHRSPRNRGLFLREILENRDFLRRLSPSSTQHFCYPNGDYDARFVPWLRECGIESAVTCDVGFATRGTERLLLPRLVDTSHLSGIEFEGWLFGTSEFLPRRRPTTAGPRRVASKPPAASA